MAYQPPQIPQATKTNDYQMTQDDQRVTVDSPQPVVIDLPDAQESYERSRRFILINAGSGMVSWRGKFASSNEPTTVTIPLNMMREALPFKRDDGTFSYVATAAQNADTRGIHLEEPDGTRFANVRTIVVPNGWLTLNEDGSVTFGVPAASASIAGLMSAALFNRINTAKFPNWRNLTTSVPAMLGTTSSTITIPFSPAMPSTSYRANATLVGTSGSIVASPMILQKNLSSVVVSVSNLGGSILANSLNVDVMLRHDTSI